DEREEPRSRGHRRLRDPDTGAHRRALVGLVRRGRVPGPRGRRNDCHPIPRARSARLARAARQGSRPRTAPDLRHPDPHLHRSDTREPRMMNRTTVRNLVTSAVAAAALATRALGAVQAADGGGIRNCVDVTGKAVNRVGCYELVWSGGTEYRMTFSNLTFSGSTPRDLDPFYVLASQTDRPQGAPP